MYSLFCPPCAVATAVTRFDGSSWANNCCFVNPCMARNVVREGYGIEGHCCSDLLCTCLFLPCMTGQLLAETAERGSVIDHWARSNRYRSPTLTQWKFGLCGFTEDPGKLFYALCMPWCALGSVRTDLDGSDWIFNCCFLNSCAARAMVRHAYNIEGTTANDVATSCFCLPCAISQMMIEVQHRGRVNGPERLVVGPPGVQLQSMVR
ncbi:hypothetical protein JKP88DRAFT_189519 [Tribonema minus]|uniref:Uncharacterized protein n=1 Tax=Tribonema minus TaxID=303371 RepID=A0A835YTR6_9STRA|nr:hypothetical protein JKP88DRAFT_189519 [Tribonema minus]